MSDDKDTQRISDAADNCEVLRARLAKYEDADGNPLASLKQPSAGVDERTAFEAIEWLDDFVARCNGDDRGACESVNIIRHALQARAQLAAPAGVPDGYTLVPTEPTPEMIQAALDKPCFDSLGDLLPWSHITRTSYAAMLAAAPSPAPASGLTNVRCQCCQSEHAHNSYDAGFIAGSGMCQVCDAALPAKDLPPSEVWMIPTVKQLEQALDSVPRFRDLSAELIAPAMLEHLRGVITTGEFGDPYQGAREDLAIWKRRALEAETKIREQDHIIESLGNALNDENGPTFMGKPVLKPSSDVVPVPRELLRAALEDHNSSARYEAKRELRALLNGGRS